MNKSLADDPRVMTNRSLRWFIFLIVLAWIADLVWVGYLLVTGQQVDWGVWLFTLGLPLMLLRGVREWRRRQAKAPD